MNAANGNTVHQLKSAEETARVYVVTENKVSAQEWLGKITPILAIIKNELNIDIIFSEISFFDIRKQKNNTIIITDQPLMVKENKKRVLIINLHKEFYSNPEHPSISSWKYWFEPNKKQLNIRKSSVRNPGFMHNIFKTFFSPPVIIMPKNERVNITSFIEYFFPLSKFHYSNKLNNFKLDNSRLGVLFISLNNGENFGLRTNLEESYITIFKLDCNLNSLSNPKTILIKKTSQNALLQINEHSIFSLLNSINNTANAFGHFDYYSNQENITMALHDSDISYIHASSKLDSINSFQI